MFRQNNVFGSFLPFPMVTSQVSIHDHTCTHLLYVVNRTVAMRAFVVLSNGKNGTIGRQIPFKVLPMVPLVMPLVPMVPMLPIYGSK